MTVNDHLQVQVEENDDTRKVTVTFSPSTTEIVVVDDEADHYRDGRSL